MQLLLTLAVFAALVVAEAAPAGVPNHLAWRTLGVIVVSLLAPLSALALTRETLGLLRSRPDERRRWLRRFRRLRLAHGALWLMGVAVVVYVLQWAAVVKGGWGMEGWLLVDEVLLLVPILAPLVLSWVAFFDVEHEIRSTASETTEGLALRRPHEGWTRSSYVGFLVRCNLGLVLPPILLLLASRDIAALIFPGVLTSEHAWAVFLPPLAIVVVFFPLMLRLAWRTVPLPDGPLRQRLSAVAGAYRLKVRNILIWDTRGMVLNAAVAGILPSMRYVFLSDALLEQLTDEELVAVFGHEVGHIRHRHVLLRMLVLLVPISLASLAQVVLPAWSGAAHNLLAWGTPTVGALAGLVGLAGMGLYMGLVFGFCSRRLECQADLFGCRVATADLATSAGRIESPPLGKGGEGGSAAECIGASPAPARSWLSPEGIRVFISALEKLAVANGMPRDSGGWQHWSVAKRVAFLESVAVNPAHARRCEWQIRVLGGLLVGLVAAGLATPLFTTLGM